MKKILKAVVVLVIVVVAVYAYTTVRNNKKISPDMLMANASLGASNIQLNSEGVPNFSNLSYNNMKVGFNPEDWLEWFGDGMVSDDVIEVINELDPEVLRFPGGTIANFYHYDEPGYGRSNVPFDKQFSENHIYRFIDAVQRLDNPDVEVCAVLNIQEHFPNKLDDQELVNDNMAMLRILHENNINVTCYEIGNELYAKPEVVGWASWNLNAIANNTRKFLNLAEQYADRILAEYPDAKYIGVPVGNPASRPQLVWNVVVLQELPDNINSIIPHIYGWIPDNWNQGGNYNNLRNAMDNFINNKANEFTFVSQNLPHINILVTEWNTFHHRQNASYAQELAGHPIAQEYAYRMLEMFERTGVDMALRHRMIGPSDRTPYNTATLDRSTGAVTLEPISAMFTEARR